MIFAAQLHDLKMMLPWVHLRRQQEAMRGLVEQQRRILTHEQVQEQSARILAQIEQMTCFVEAKTVLL